MRDKNNFGFTLIEILVVIAIIAVLSTLSIIVFDSARIKTRNTRRKADIKQIVTALELYADKYDGIYPDTTGGTGTYLITTLKCLGLGTSETCFGGRHSGFDDLKDGLAPYISQVPKDPKRKNEIFDGYLYSSACHESHLPPDGGTCVYWQPEGTINAEACEPGIVGNSGSDVCGYNCNFCAVGVSN